MKIITNENLLKCVYVRTHLMSSNECIYTCICWHHLTFQF